MKNSQCACLGVGQRKRLRKKEGKADDKNTK